MYLTLNSNYTSIFDQNQNSTLHTYYKVFVVFTPFNMKINNNIYPLQYIQKHFWSTLQEGISVVLLIKFFKKKKRCEKYFIYEFVMI